MIDREVTINELSELSISLFAMGYPVSGMVCINAMTLLKEQGHRWISVKDRLPEKNGEYLVSLCDSPDGSYITSALYERGRQVSEWTDTFEEYIDYRVSHWMPLPEPPKEVEGNA